MEGIFKDNTKKIDNNTQRFNKWNRNFRILLAGLVLNSGLVMANPNWQDKSDIPVNNKIKTAEKTKLEISISKEEKEIISNAIYNIIIGNIAFTEDEKMKLKEERNTLLFLSLVGEIHFLFVNNIYTGGIYGDNFIVNSFNVLNSIYTSDQLKYFVSKENEFILQGIDQKDDKVMEAYNRFYKKLPSNIIICDSIKKQYEENYIRPWVYKMYKNEDNRSLIFLWKYRDDLPHDIRVFISDSEWNRIKDIYEKPYSIPYMNRGNNDISRGLFF